VGSCMSGRFGRWGKLHLEEVLAVDIRHIRTASPQSPLTIPLRFPEIIISRRDSAIAAVSPSERGLGVRVQTTRHGIAGPSAYLAIDFTHPHFGGKRAWLTCPTCGENRQAIYLASKRWECRQCSDLAYRSTRISAADQNLESAIRQRRTIQARLGPTLSRPAGMHLSTYGSLLADLRTTADAEMDCWRLALDDPRS
jgi:hypothetical protein